ncbi:MAG TPA: GLUG motif-containing protein [Anaerohalosphaeraceae bacterium]|nr:GLUG motif-containing protein [Anaerohalosphaeraceae bacterium]
MRHYRNLCIAVTACLCSALCFGLNGSGTSGDPYLIQSMDDFNEFRTSSSYWSGHVRLDCELDFAGTTFYGSCISYFSGVFDGNHQPIRNLKLDSSSETVGFFGSLYSAQVYDVEFVDPDVEGYERFGIVCGYAETSTIRNCTVTNMQMLVHRYGGGIAGYDSGSTISDCSVSGELTGYEDYGTESRCLGGILGYCFNGTVVEDCHSQITIKKYTAYHKLSSLGGLIGNLGLGQVRRCTSICTITGRYYIGGLLGESIRPDNIVEDCSAEATLEGYECVGGLIGRNGNSTTSNYVGGTVRRCSSKATVTSTNRFVGGLIGYNYAGAILQCRSESAVTGPSFVGGLMGTSNGQIQDCYAVGSVNGTSMSYGGLIGTTGAAIARCYAAVVLSGSTTMRGGLFGVLETAGNASSCFWDSQIQTTAGIQSIGDKKGTATNVYAKTTPEMKTQSTFTAYGWDFTNETANGSADIWRLCTDGAAYPRLSWEFPRSDMACPDGVGVEDLLVLSGQWLLTGLSPNTGADLSGDGSITLDDAAILSRAWLANP